MKKTDIETRYIRGEYIPCINVKCYNWPRADKISERFNCSQENAERAGNFAWESAQEQFWDEAQELAAHYLGERVEVFSDGRSSGWLIVKGLAEVESWDAIAVSRWSRFAKAVASSIAYLSSLDSLCDAIESNEWTKDYAERFNFIDRKDGSHACIADLKAGAIAAGFESVVRA